MKKLVACMMVICYFTATYAQKGCKEYQVAKLEKDSVLIEKSKIGGTISADEGIVEKYGVQKVLQAWWTGKKVDGEEQVALIYNYWGTKRKITMKKESIIKKYDDVTDAVVSPTAGEVITDIKQIKKAKPVIHAKTGCCIKENPPVYNEGKDTWNLAIEVFVGWILTMVCGFLAWPLSKNPRTMICLSYITISSIVFIVMGILMGVWIPLAMNAVCAIIGSGIKRTSLRK